MIMNKLAPENDNQAGIVETPELQTTVSKLKSKHCPSMTAVIHLVPHPCGSHCYPLPAPLVRRQIPLLPA